MIVVLADGGSFSAPTDADFRIRMASPFTADELIDPSTTMQLSYRDAFGAVGGVSLAPDGTDIIADVAAGTFIPGTYYLNPRLVVGGKTRRWIFPVVMFVTDDFTPVGNNAI